MLTQMYIQLFPYVMVVGKVTLLHIPALDCGYIEFLYNTACRASQIFGRLQLIYQQQ